jgi:hypothetical protein
MMKDLTLVSSMTDLANSQSPLARRNLVLGALPALTGCDLQLVKNILDGAVTAMQPKRIDPRDTDAVFKAMPKNPEAWRLESGAAFAVPPQFMRWWEHTPENLAWRQALPPVAEQTPPTIRGKGLEWLMFWPDFRGFDRDNYNVEFHQDRIWVVDVAPEPLENMEIGKTGSYVPAVIQRYRENPYTDTENPIKQYGMVCFRSQAGYDYCIGSSLESPDEQFALDYTLDPEKKGLVDPDIRAHYTTREHGGLSIKWIARLKHLENAAAIDAQIRRYLRAWRIK